MPELRSSAWSAVQSFPAPDGSRTLRVSVSNEVIDALQTKALRGIRQSYVWVRQTPQSPKRLMTETEVLAANSTWMSLPDWQESRGGAVAKSVPSAGEDYRLPALVVAHLKCGRLRSVTQKLTHCASGIQAVVTVESDTKRESLQEYMARESAAVEMCVPLSSEEAVAFFSDGPISGVRHTWVNMAPQDGEHVVEIHSDGKWSTLTSNEVFVWNKVVAPHFRFTFSAGGGAQPDDRRRENINSPSPWVH